MSKSVAIVTGASQGIGQSTAIRLARDFSALVLVARSRSNLEQTAETVKAAGAQVLVIDADLAQPAAAQPIVDQALAAFGRIDALLNIAGGVPQIDLFEMTDEQWEGGLALKLHGAPQADDRCVAGIEGSQGLGRADVRGTRRYSPRRPMRPVGTINAAIVALAKAFSDRGITDGVQVNSVLPGPVMTGRRRSYLQHWAPLHDMTVEGGNGQLPEGSGYRALWRAGGNRRTDGIPGIAGRTLDDRLDAPDGWRRGQVDLRFSRPRRDAALNAAAPRDCGACPRGVVIPLRGSSLRRFQATL